MSHYITQVSFMLIAFEIIVNSNGINYKTFYRKKAFLYYIEQNKNQFLGNGVS